MNKLPLTVLNKYIYIKEARAGCGLKNRLHDFFLFLYVLYRYSDYIYAKKKILHRNCSETGAISNYVSNIAFLYEMYREKTLLFALNFNKKKPNSWNFEKMINYICMGIDLILVRKKVESVLIYWRGVISNFENVSNERRFRK